MKKSRLFSAIYKSPTNNVIETGKFHGKNPKQAANKAFTAIKRTYKKNNINLPHIIFAMREQTVGSKHKTYTYKGTSYTLNNPVIIQVNTASKSKTIMFKEFPTITPINKCLCDHLFETQHENQLN